MYFQKCIANPAHLAGLFCPVLFCPQKAIAVGIKFLAHFCYPLIKKTWKIFSKVGMVFCYYNCSDLLWEKIVPVIEKFFWNSRPSASNLQNFWDHLNNLFKQWKVRTISGHRMLFDRELSRSYTYLQSGGWFQCHFHVLSENRVNSHHVRQIIDWRFSFHCHFHVLSENRVNSHHVLQITGAP